jgi:hypothetical protein
MYSSPATIAAARGLPGSSYTVACENQFTNGIKDPEPAYSFTNFKFLIIPCVRSCK